MFLLIVYSSAFAQNKDTLLSLSNSFNTYISSDIIKKFPNKNINNILSFSEGISLYNGKVYMNGGRASELSFQLNGLPLAELYDGGTSLTLPFEAIDRIEIRKPVVPAEIGFGHTNSINYSLKKGGKTTEWYVNYETDNISFRSSESVYNGVKNFGAYSYGYNYFTASISGEAIKNVYYYLLFNQKFMRDKNPSAMPEIKDTVTFRPDYTVTKFDLNGGLIKNNSQEINSAIGNFNWDMDNIQIQLSSIYQWGHYNDGVTNSFFHIFRSMRNAFTKEKTFSAVLSFKHKISDKMRYEIAASYNNYFKETMDPYLKDDYLHYYDTITARKLGFNPKDYFSFMSGTSALYLPTVMYSKSKNESFNLKAVFTLTGLLSDSIKFGGEFSISRLREFSPSSEYIYYYNFQVLYLGKSEDVKQRYYTGNNIYGYDYEGNEINDNSIYGPRKPIFGAIFLQNDFTMGRLSGSIGLRGDLFYADNYSIDFWYFDEMVYSETSDESRFPKIKASYFNINPRILLKYKIDNTSLLEGNFGTYTQIPRFSDLYESLYYYSFISFAHTFPAYASPELKPSRSIVTELTYSKIIGNDLLLKLGGELKFLSNLPVLYVNDYFDTPMPENQGKTNIKSIKLAIEYIPFTNASLSLNTQYNFINGITLNYMDNSGSAYLVSGNYNSLMTFQNAPLEAYPDFTANILFSYNSGNHLKEIFLDDITISTSVKINSGYHYTRTGSYIYSTALNSFNAFSYYSSDINGASTGWSYQIDLMIEKQLRVAGFLNTSFYLTILNLLNTKNEINHFTYTGSADIDGHLTSTNFDTYISFYGIGYKRYYDIKEKYNAAFNYGQPLQIRLGVKLLF